VDRNRNRDLTDDGPPLESEGAGGFGTSLRLPLPEVTGRAGRLFPAGDESALAMHLREVLGSRDEAARMSAEGRAHAATYSWDRAAREIEIVLREAVALGRRKRVGEQLGSLKSLTRWLR
jgi:glycosyltransferase involved in cell wall biosynthesis